VNGRGFLCRGPGKYYKVFEQKGAKGGGRDRGTIFRVLRMLGVRIVCFCLVLLRFYWSIVLGWLVILGFSRRQFEAGLLGWVIL